VEKLYQLLDGGITIGAGIVLRGSSVRASHEMQMSALSRNAR